MNFDKPNEFAGYLLAAIDVLQIQNIPSPYYLYMNLDIFNEFKLNGIIAIAGFRVNVEETELRGEDVIKLTLED